MNKLFIEIILLLCISGYSDKNNKYFYNYLSIIGLRKITTIGTTVKLSSTGVGSAFAVAASATTTTTTTDDVLTTGVHLYNGLQQATDTNWRYYQQKQQQQQSYKYQQGKQQQQQQQQNKFKHKLPEFIKVPYVIEVTPGQTVILSCKVTYLGDRMVSWIRSKDLQILTSGDTAFTADYRFSTDYTFTDGIYSWGLIIKNVRQTDGGQYECQINTEPKIKQHVQLIVREQQQMDIPYIGPRIEGPRELIVKKLTTIEFHCIAPIINYDGVNHQQTITPSSHATSISGRNVVWTKDGKGINFQAERGGVSVHTQWGLNSVSSRLGLAHVMHNDSGIYACSITSIGTDQVSLHVVDGENPQISSLHDNNNNYKKNKEFSNGGGVGGGAGTLFFQTTNKINKLLLIIILLYFN